jgi:hypothetical protein
MKTELPRPWIKHLSNPSDTRAWLRVCLLAFLLGAAAATAVMTVGVCALLSV